MHVIDLGSKRVDWVPVNVIVLLLVVSLTCLGVSEVVGWRLGRRGHPRARLTVLLASSAVTRLLGALAIAVVGWGTRPWGLLGWILALPVVFNAIVIAAALASMIRRDDFDVGAPTSPVPRTRSRTGKSLPS